MSLRKRCRLLAGAALEAWLCLTREEQQALLLVLTITALGLAAKAWMHP